MGIINITPDSFYDGGKTTVIRDIVAQASRMLNEGATFLDIGGYSSRPGATHISVEEEVKRTIPAIEAIISDFPKAIISIDTFRSTVAKKAIKAGAALVNDISGGNLDAKMMETVGALQVPYICMHLKGTPQTMQNETNYQNILKEVLYYFSEKMSEARAHGINDFIADPGFGFAKTTAQSFELLGQLEIFQQLEVPILAGISRKSMIYKTLEISATEALNGTTALHSIALQKGTQLLRVHDVKEAMECVALHQALKG